VPNGSICRTVARKMLFKPGISNIDLYADLSRGMQLMRAKKVLMPI
jgi:hypothetical protein